MPYGRLDVFWPDGKFQTFPLSDSTVTVGRSGGSRISLETESISRYHFSLTHANGQAYITDMESANGTFVDGQRLPTGQRQPLYGGEEIQVGELRMIYNTFDDSPTRPMVVPEEATQRIELEAPAYRIDLMGPGQAVSPGAHISAELAITNTGSDKERYVIDVTGLPRDWVRVDRQIVEIAPDKAETVIINFKPTRRSESAPGDYQAFVTVRPNRDGAPMLNADFVLSVLPYGGFGMALEPTELGPDGRFRLHLHNQGSHPLPLHVAVADHEPQLSAALPTTQVVLTPGQRLMIQGAVTPRQRKLFGEPEQIPFDVVVTSRDAAGFTAAQRGYATVRPTLPRWAPLAILGSVAALIVALLAIIFILNNRPPVPPPTIDQFTLSSSAPIQGEPLTVEWQAANAEQVVLTLNGTPLFQDEGAELATSFIIDTSELSGPISIGLTVENASGVEAATQVVDVTQPLRIEQFAVTPGELVRNVVQTVTIQWNVPGATQTRLLGLESFTTAQLEPTYGAQGSIGDLVGIPVMPLTLTLHAEDAQGRAAEQTITIEIVDPLCAPSSDAVTLYSQPQASSQVIGTVPSGSTVIVDAQDETSQWLRLVLAGGLQGWGPRNSFRCADNFRIENLRQVLIVPTVGPAQTGSPVAPATAVTPTTASPLVTATPRAGTTRPAVTTTPAPTLAPTQATPIAPGP
jgi:hypothetical protein